MGGEWGGLYTLKSSTPEYEEEHQLLECKMWHKNSDLNQPEITGEDKRSFSLIKDTVHKVTVL